MSFLSLLPNQRVKLAAQALTVRQQRSFGRPPGLPHSCHGEAPMWKAQYEMTTDVAPSALYRAIADVNNWSQWDAGLEYTRLMGDVKPGAAFVLKPKGGPKVQDDTRVCGCRWADNHPLRDRSLGPLGVPLAEGSGGEPDQGSAGAAHRIRSIRATTP